MQTICARSSNYLHVAVLYAAGKSRNEQKQRKASFSNSFLNSEGSITGFSVFDTWSIVASEKFPRSLWSYFSRVFLRRHDTLPMKLEILSAQGLCKPSFIVVISSHGYLKGSVVGLIRVWESVAPEIDSWPNFVSSIISTSSFISPSEYSTSIISESELYSVSKTGNFRRSPWTLSMRWCMESGIRYIHINGDAELFNDWIWTLKGVFNTHRQYFSNFDSWMNQEIL